MGHPSGNIVPVETETPIKPHEMGFVGHRYSQLTLKLQDKDLKCKEAIMALEIGGLHIISLPFLETVDH